MKNERRIFETGLDISLKKIVTTYTDNSIRIQGIEYKEIAYNCCKEAHEHVTFEGFSPRMKKVFFYCHGCDTDQEIKYHIVDVSLNKPNW